MEKMKNLDFVKYENSKSDEYIRLDTTIIGIDNLIAKASSAEEANALFKVKDVIYSQKRHSTYIQPDNGWISVKDEMPKLGQRVMAFCRAGILTFLRYDGEVWFEMSSRNEYLLSFVTHWQYLPEPPKGE